MENFCQHYGLTGTFHEQSDLGWGWGRCTYVNQAHDTTTISHDLRRGVQAQEY